MKNWIVVSWKNFILPPKSAVYAVYIGGKLTYIGQSVDIRNRFYEHNIRYGYAKNIITPWGDYQDDSTITIKYSLSKKYGDWAMRELRLIRRLRPPLNKSGKGRKSLIKNSYGRE